MGVGRESRRGRESAWGTDSRWAGRTDRQVEWMDRERGWARRADVAGRLEKTGTVDGVGKVAQLNFFVPLPTFESLHSIFTHFVIHNSLLILVSAVS